MIMLVPPVKPLGVSVRIGCPVATSHTFVIVPLSRRRRGKRAASPSGLNATSTIEIWCPLRERISFPVAASHTLTVLS